MSHKLLKSTAIVGGMTLISRVLGLLRDMVLARWFGADAGMDAFFVAFKIPNFLRRLFAEGAFSQAFVPVISEYRAQRTHAEVQQLANRVAGTLLGILSGITVLGVLASPVLVTIFAPGFLQRDPGQFELAAELLRLTFPYLLFVSLVAFAAGILNTYGRFAAASFVSVWLNVVLIGAAVLVSPLLDQPEIALAGGVFVAGVVQVLFLLPSLKRIGIFPRPRWGLRDEGVRRIMKLMLPGILGSSVAQINLLFDTLIASFLVAGSVSWLYYSDRLVEFPLGVFAIALSTVILPSLSRSHANGSSEEFSRTLDWGLRLVLLIGIPATIGLFALARPMLATLFQYGDFSAGDVSMAGLSLMAYAVGLPGFMLIRVLAPAFYSRKDTRTPVRIAIIALITNMALNLLFVVPMVMLAIKGPHAGLALATSLAAWVNAALLYRALKQRGIYTAQDGWARTWTQLLLASAVLAVALAWGVPAHGVWIDWSAGQRVTGLLLCVAAGVAVYLLALQLAGMRLLDLWRQQPHGGESGD
ncbi:MAG: murein biosynthesis integral membrane protein MurJ [Gammaproteobacteria bacterium]|nr:murein biosynthesis integral membrane protein MurJ [Gammaproteobacteria bacterium]